MLEHLMILVLLYCIYFCHLLFTHLFVAFSDTFTFVVYLFFFFSSRRRHTRSEEHRSELLSLRHLVCRLLLEKKKIRVESPVHGDDRYGHFGEEELGQSDRAAEALRAADDHEACVVAAVVVLNSAI